MYISNIRHLNCFELLNSSIFLFPYRAIKTRLISKDIGDYDMPNKGDLVEFKPNTFGIPSPDNYGIYVRRYKDKRSKGHMVELFTSKGIQTTNEKNIENGSLGKRSITRK